MKINVPFIKNPGFECGQACTAMMIKYFKPDFIPDFGKLDKLIHHKKNTYTFPQQNAILLDYFGIKAMSFSSETIQTTKEDPGQFKRWFGKDYNTEMKFVNLKSFDWMVSETRKRKLFTHKITYFAELLTLFDKGYLVCIPVNWNVLNNINKPYEGHFIIITGIEGVDIFVHDPDDGPFIKYNKNLLQKSWDLSPVTDDFLVAYSLK